MTVAQSISMRANNIKTTEIDTIHYNLKHNNVKEIRSFTGYLCYRQQMRTNEKKRKFAN